MTTKLDLTSYRRMIRPLSVYSEMSRAEGIAGHIKWEIGEDIRLYGQDSPAIPTRLSVVRLNANVATGGNHPDILTEVPKTRGLGASTDGRDVRIKINPEKDHITIQSDTLRYHMSKSIGAPDIVLKQQYLPMNDIKLKASIPSDTLRNYFQLAPSGPLTLKISEHTVKFVTKGVTTKAIFDLTRYLTSSPDREETEQVYNLYPLTEVICKFPSVGEIELLINENLIGFRYCFSNNVGSLHHYQRSK